METYKLICNTKDIDAKKGIVAFYFANFKTPDRNGRLMHRNAFNRTIKGNFNNMVHLLNHDPNAIIGKPIEVGTDDEGAYMVSQLSKNSLGKDALTMYEEGIYNQHSFGFEILNSEPGKEVEVVNEVRMWEASTVTWAAHPDTPTISLNELNEDRLDNIEAELIKISNQIARLPVLEHQAPQNKTELNELLTYLETI